MGDPAMRRIIVLKLSGFSNEEIAAEFGCSVRTVIRKINRIRQEWRETSGPSEDSE
jgi:DNA-directed RNA polymerase specialized sigma24 family protein